MYVQNAEISNIFKVVIIFRKQHKFLHTILRQFDQACESTYLYKKLTRNTKEIFKIFCYFL